MLAETGIAHAVGWQERKQVASKKEDIIIHTASQEEVVTNAERSQVA